MLKFFQNSKFRLLFFTLGILSAFTIIFLIITYFAKDDLILGGASLKKAPRVDSTPWSSDSTQEYIKLQEGQNISKAEKAKSSGKSAIPTIVRIESFGEGEFIKGGKETIGFSKLLNGGEVSEAQIILNSLSDTNCVIEDVKFALTQKITLKDLKTVCGCSKLKKAGVTLKKLDTVCDCISLKKAGFTAKMLKASGYTATKLRNCNYSACELKGAGFSAKQMKDAGFTDLELKGAGFSQDAIKAAAQGLVEGIDNSDILSTNCNPKKLNALRLKGITASKIREVSGCSIESLKNAGFTIQELKRAGFNARELKNAGYNAKQLMAAGFSAKDLKNAGYSSKELKDAGFGVKELKDAGFSAKDLKDAGFTAKALYENGFSAKDLLEAGYSQSNLIKAGISPAIIDKALDSMSECSVSNIKKKISKDVPLKEIINTYGCSLKNLIDAGVSPKDLLALGYTLKDLRDAGIFYDYLKDGNCSKEFISKAKIQGVTAKEIRNKLGCSSKDLKNSGFNVSDLKNAGFTAAELKDLGFNSNDLKKAGFSAKDLLKAGFSAKDLKNAGFQADELLAAGASIKSLKNAGFSAADLKSIGVSAKDLKDAGFSAKDLKNAGFNIKDLQEAGYSVTDLKDAGFNAKELLDAGYDVKDLVDVFSAKELLDAGATVEDLLKNGVSIKDLKAAGVDAKALRKAGASLDDLLKNGFANQDLQGAGFSAAQIARSQARIRASDELNFINDMGVRDSIVNNKTKKLKLRSPKELQVLQTQMSTYANALPRDWGVSDQQFVNGSTDDENEGGLGIPGRLLNNNAGVAQAAQNQQQENQPQSAALLKAGDIQFAVLDTSVNSDEPGPILATVTQGKLKGSKLIGNIEVPQNGQKAILRFNVLSIPNLGNSIPISAVAIDINTARTGISSNTNNHYFTRYGSLFASSFLEGFGKAFAAPTTTIKTVDGNINVQEVRSTAKEAAIASLAEVGTKWGDSISGTINRPPTIEIYAGVALGILLTQDLQLPE